MIWISGAVGGRRHWRRRLWCRSCHLAGAQAGDVLAAVYRLLLRCWRCCSRGWLAMQPVWVVSAWGGGSRLMTMSIGGAAVWGLVRSAQAEHQIGWCWWIYRWVGRCRGCGWFRRTLR